MSKLKEPNPLLPLALFAGSLAYFLIRQPKKKPQLGRVDSVIKPPFPDAISRMLSCCRLAYLSTVDVDSSHLSLMRFTYLKDEEDGEVVILSTRRKTKKFEMLQKQKGVALLVHDFDHQGAGGVHSITLNGTCQIIEEGKTQKILSVFSLPFFCYITKFKMCSGAC